MENKNFFEAQERDHRSSILSTIRSGLKGDTLKAELEKYHENDIASVLDELTPEERDMLLDSIGVEAMSDIVSYMEDAGDYLSELDAGEVADIIVYFPSLYPTTPHSPFKSSSTAQTPYFVARFLSNADGEPPL